MLHCRHALLFEDIGGDYNILMAANAKTVRDFDEGLTRGKYCVPEICSLFFFFFCMIQWYIIFTAHGFVIPCSVIWFQVSRRLLL